MHWPYRLRNPTTTSAKEAAIDSNSPPRKKTRRKLRSNRPLDVQESLTAVMRSVDLIHLAIYLREERNRSSLEGRPCHPICPRIISIDARGTNAALILK